MKRHLVPLGVGALALLGIGVLWAQAPEAKARNKSVTVYPVAITPDRNIPVSLPQRMAEVVGTFLERAGMEEIEIAEGSFSPPETDDVSKVAGAFGQFVGKQPPNTEYALFAEILGTHKTGIRAVRTIVVDQTGKVIFGEQAEEKIFAGSKTRPKEPMSACIFMVNRLDHVWDLADPLRKDAPQGKMAERLKRRSGSPAEQELAGMKKRLNVLKGRLADAKITVYPIHLWQGSDKASAVQLADMLSKQDVCRAVPAEIDPKLKIQGDPNQQKILWDTARAFGKFLRDNPPATEYALLADYGMSPSSDGKHQASHVHLILCDRSGECVLVDYQNSHHGDFQSIDPKTRQTCNRLAVKRLKRRLAE